MQPYATHDLRDPPRAPPVRKPQRYASKAAAEAQPAGANAADFDVAAATLGTNTHWTRIFYYDVLDAKDEPRSGYARKRQAVMGWIHGTPLRQGMALLGIYAVMHLAAGVLLRLLHT